MKNHIILLLLLTTFLILGCIQEVGKPEIRGISHKWGNVTSSTTEIITIIKVYNPNPIPLPLKDILTEVYMNNIKMGEGSALKAEIKANSESEIIISTKLENSKIPEWWVTHIKNGEKTTMNIKGYLVFDLKVTEFKYPIELSNSIETDILAGLSSDKPRKINVGPVTLTIKSVRSYWGEVNEDYTEIITLATIYNDNLIPVPIVKFYYLVEMNGIKVAEGSSTIETVIKPKSEETITFITKIDNNLLDEWWVSHIKNGERTKVKILIQPVIKVHNKEFKFTVAEKEDEFTTNLLD
ncbi:MAG TPA: hypothetical protein EYH04_03275 [Archaeoglobus profundus]|nr:hypothetical protein [Archaeoglobus profundus]